jgi:hypothetical protein
MGKHLSAHKKTPNKSGQIALLKVNYFFSNQCIV